MSSVKLFADRIVSWTAANMRSFSYLLPDSVELLLYLAVAGYFIMQLQQQA
jgi:hypothetical protein